MPSNIAHMLIARMARKKLIADAQDSNDQTLLEFVRDKLDTEGKKVFMELGSVGPDLPYYENLAKGLKDILFSRSDKPLGVDQWSYQLHSRDPNVFPLKMIEIAWKETDMDMTDWEDTDEAQANDYLKLAFICGYLTHMAADQIIHPVVNKIAGPYYKTTPAREEHRACEIYQDVVLYQTKQQEMELGEFEQAKFNKWCDLIPRPWTGRNTEDWFRYFIQKTYVEAHAMAPEAESVESWVDGILVLMRLANVRGPFMDAYADYKDSGNGANSDKYKKYILLNTIEKPDGADYFAYIENAVELASVYIKAAHKMFELKGLNDESRNRFKSVVRNADLGSPLEEDILATAKKNLADWQ
ncbi:MAG: zinc dependent phospholipase C family protein [Nitrospinota bacterium]|nr:zinc dependent phospholipase C family protein [Nitrospinota bacterium]